jgi:hypothetical protein
MNCRPLILIIAALTLALPRLHALTLEQSFRFNRRGACEVVYLYLVQESRAGAVKAMRQSLERRLDASRGMDFFSEKAVRDHFADLPGGRLVSYNLQHYRHQGEPCVAVRIALRLEQPRLAFASGALGELMLRDSIHLGDLELDLPLPAHDKPLAPAEAERLDAWLDLLGGLEVVVRIETPTELIECNGRREAFNRAVWRYDARLLKAGGLPAIHVRW